jgi:hypothetical protein
MEAMNNQLTKTMNSAASAVLVSALVACIVGCGERTPLELSNYSSLRKEMAIIDGELVDAETHASTGALVFSDDAGQHLFCTGTLIAEDVVLTAAHCVNIIPDLRMQGKIISFALTGDVASGVNAAESRFTQYEIHPSYALDSMLPPERMPVCNVPSDEVDERLCSDVKACSNRLHGDMQTCIDGLWFGYTQECQEYRGLDYEACEESFYFALGLKGLSDAADIALVYLDDKIRNVKPSRVLQPWQADLLQEGVPVTIVGFGQRSPVPGQGASGYKVSAESIMTEVGYGEIKVGHDPSLPQQCFGDSGGPTFLDIKDERPVVIGVTSRGYDWGDCNKGGVETRVDIFFNWLDERMVSACASGLRKHCSGGGTLVPRAELVMDESLAASVSVADSGCSSMQASQNMMPVWALLMGWLILQRRKKLALVRV